MKYTWSSSNPPPLFFFPLSATFWHYDRARLILTFWLIWLISFNIFSIIIALSSHKNTSCLRREVTQVPLQLHTFTQDSFYLIVKSTSVRISYSSFLTVACAYHSLCILWLWIQCVKNTQGHRDHISEMSFWCKTCLCSFNNEEEVDKRGVVAAVIVCLHKTTGME